MNLERTLVATTVSVSAAVIITCVVGAARLVDGPITTPLVVGVVVIDMCAASAAFVYRRMLRASIAANDGLHEHGREMFFTDHAN